MLFAVDESVTATCLTPPSIRIFLEKLGQNDNNIYFKHCKKETSNPYSRYFIFHSLNPSIINPDHLMINLRNTKISAVRITSAHKNIPLYRAFMNANPKQEWLEFENQPDISILVPKIIAKTHAKVMTQFITTRTPAYLPEDVSIKPLLNKNVLVENEPQRSLDYSTPGGKNHLPILPTRRNVGPE